MSDKYKACCRTCERLKWFGEESQTYCGDDGDFIRLNDCCNDYIIREDLKEEDNNTK